MGRYIAISYFPIQREIFSSLEDQAILDVNSEIDLFCLYAIFTGHIDASIENFIRSWNSYPLSLENNQTPL